ncbi:hydroxyacid dehydrogenase [Fodinicurvata sp. EGI_FJ10296]|uniref:hydroxyacid dehydrogenase n=1 Tax=Fodinicurvata sp. EGI_FJ10296 TaxID=3231908 RepID=UPI0034545EF4
MAATDVLIIQPIHRAGLDMLQAAGLRLRFATSSDMATVAAEIPGAVAAITRNAGLDRAAMDAAVDLRVLGNHGIGVDPIDTAHASEIGLPVVFTPFANVQSVAEQALALMLAVAKSVPAADAATRRGDFGFKYQTPLVELHGKTLGIVGYGRIGRRTAALARAAFSMPLIVYSPSVPAAAIEADGGQKADSIDALLTEADVVSLHAPLRPESRNLIGAERLALMKPSSILVNTGRGGVVDETALIAHLQARRSLGAGLDVFATESMPPDYPLLSLPNVVLSPHIAGSTEDALKRTAEQVAVQIIDALAGRRPEHLVNPDVWEHRRHG